MDGKTERTALGLEEKRLETAIRDQVDKARILQIAADSLALKIQTVGSRIWISSQSLRRAAHEPVIDFAKCGRLWREREEDRAERRSARKGLLEARARLAKVVREHKILTAALEEVRGRLDCLGEVIALPTRPHQDGGDQGPELD